MIATILEILGFLLIIGATVVSGIPMMSGISTSLAILGATLVIYGLARRIIKHLKVLNMAHQPTHEEHGETK